MSEQPIAYEEVPGSRTTQQAVDQPKPERIAYEDLQPGDIIQEGDEWQTESGRWKPFASLDKSFVHVRYFQKARRPYKISTIQEIGDALANAQKAATQLQDERDEARNERDLARSEVARLSTELWARKPLEDRVTSLTNELAQAREGNQQLLKTIAENADMFADAGKILERERDELQTALIESRLLQQRKVAEVMEVCRERDEVEAELKRVQEVVRNLYDEPTARQVQQMLRTWATELEWSADCFDSAGRDKVSAAQRTLIAVMERIESLLNPEGGINED